MTGSSHPPGPTHRSWSVFPWWFLRLYRRPLAFVAILLVPLGLVSGWFYTTHEREWRAREGRDLLVAAQLASRIIQEELDRTRKIQEAVTSRATFLEAVRAHDRTTLITFLQVLLDVTPMIDRAVITDATGRILASLPPATSADDPPLPDADPRTSPLSSPGVVSGVYLRSQASGEKAVNVSSPILDGQTTLGSLQVQYRLQDVSRWLEKVRIEPAGFLYVVDQGGFLVAYPFQLLPGRPKNVSGWVPVAHAASTQGELIRFIQGDPPKPWTAAVVPVEPFGWRVIAQQPDAAMLRPLHQLVWWFVASAGLLLGSMGLLALRWASLHQATLRLVAQQARLLKTSEQRRLSERLRRHHDQAPGGGDVP